MSEAGWAYGVAGANQSRMRAHNERLLLTALRFEGPTPGGQLAKTLGLSAQTVSNIIRDMEEDGVLQRGRPLRGRVGKPSVPMCLAAEGAYSFGLKIGRRTTDLAMMNLHGDVVDALRLTHRYPMPGPVMAFLEEGMAQMTDALRPHVRSRICGLGVAAPFELWHWSAEFNAPRAEFLEWKNFDIAQEVARFSPLPVTVLNDATAACRAEHSFGRGKEFRDYAYFFVGAFVGGGIVLNNGVVEGGRGNAGALGSLQTSDGSGRPALLLDTASIRHLEADLTSRGLLNDEIARKPEAWHAHPRVVRNWINMTASELARAALSVCAVVDFEAVLVDGTFPDFVRQSLVAQMEAEIVRFDRRGILPPKIVAGTVGEAAGVMGAAFRPIESQYFLSDTQAPFLTHQS